MSSFAFHMAVENYLLAAMPCELYDKLAPNLKRVSLQRGDMLHYPGEIIEDLYFPIDCVIAIAITMNDGRTAETGLAGKREAMGINAFMGGSETTQTTYIVQVAGSAFKMDARPLLEEFNCNKDDRDVLLPYTQAFIPQISQTTACNRLHTLEQRDRTLAAGSARPRRIKRSEADAGVHRRHAGRAPRRCHPSRPKASG